MSALLDFIHNVLDPIGIVVGLVIAIPVFWTWWQVVFGERRRLRRWHREARNDPGDRPAILLVDLLPGRDIATSVQHARVAVEKLGAVPDERVVRVTREQPLTPADMPDLMRELRAAHRRLMEAGTDVIHVFFAGPCVAAAVLGAELSNSGRISLYHYEQGRYVNFGPMQL